MIDSEMLDALVLAFAMLPLIVGALWYACEFLSDDTQELLDEKSR